MTRDSIYYKTRQFKIYVRPRSVLGRHVLQKSGFTVFTNVSQFVLGIRTWFKSFNKKEDDPFFFFILLHVCDVVVDPFKAPTSVRPRSDKETTGVFVVLPHFHFLWYFPHFYVQINFNCRNVVITRSNCCGVPVVMVQSHPKKIYYFSAEHI